MVKPWCRDCSARHAVQLGLLLALVLGMLGTLAWLVLHQEDGQHAAFDVLSQEVLAVDARLNRDVMQARHGYLRHYDSQVQAQQQMQGLLERLQQRLSEVGLSEVQQPLLQAWSVRTGLLDSFARMNAQRVNAQAQFLHLTQMLTDVEAFDPRLSEEVLRMVPRVAAVLLRESLEGGEDRLVQLMSRWSLSEEEDLRLLASHAQRVLELQQRTDALVVQLLSQPLEVQVRYVMGAYADHRHRQRALAARVQWVLVLLLGLLVTALVLLGSAWQRAARARRAAEHRLRLSAHVFDNLSEALLVTNAAGLIESVNPAFTRITGFSEREAVGHTPGGLLRSGEHDALFYRKMWDTLLNQGQWQGEVVNRRKSGERFCEWLSIVAVRDEEGEIIQFIGLFSDITDRKESEARIYHIAYHDTLTGLPNRQQFADHLRQRVGQSQRQRENFALLLLDLDQFKEINDALGHLAGDELLCLVTERLQPLVSDEMFLARLGGDEFVILASQCHSQPELEVMAERLLRAFDLPFVISGREVFTSVSMGIVIFPQDATTPELLLKHADLAMYAAKRSGRHAYRFYQAHDAARVNERLALGNDLRRALEADQFRLFYQPQVCARTGQVHACEALIRWHHPERGMVPPVAFIPLAEESGLVVDIGYWVLETACAQLARWRAQDGSIEQVAVNVSVRQLREPDFVARVLATCTRHGVRPGQLELELTESLLAENAERAFAVFEQLRQRGLRIAIDDFGTGYSSLSYLSRYPVDVVKIDRSFVMNLPDDTEAASVARAVVMLAHGLNMSVVAEGVETPEQGVFLRDLGVDLLQGYWFAKPLPVTELAALKVPSLPLKED